MIPVPYLLRAIHDVSLRQSHTKQTNKQTNACEQKQNLYVYCRAS